MTRITPRFIPVVELRRPIRPAVEPLYYDWMVDQLRDCGLTKPGLFSGMRYTKISDNPVDFDGVPGLPSKLYSSALTADYEVLWENTSASSYTYAPTPQEKAWRDLDIAIYNTRLAEIKESLATAKGDDKTELETELASVTAILDQLNQGGHGYLRTSYNAMGSLVSGIMWGLNAPNIPVKLTSSFIMERDECFAFAFERYVALEDQVLKRFIVSFGNGFTQYALAIGEDGNSTEFWHYRNMSSGAREKLENQLEALLDFGRLTVADRKQILEWEIEERSIRARAKKRSEGEKKLTAQESARIEELHDLEQNLKDSKQLTSEQQDEIRELENKIFLAQRTFKLQEESNELIGRRVDVTVQFLQSGFVVIRSGQTEFVYENSRVTGLEPPQFHFGLPEKSKLSIYSDGGKFGFLFGFMEWAKESLLLSQPWRSREKLNPDDFNARMVGALLSQSKTENGKLWEYGCEATAKVVELQEPVNNKPGLYQLELKFTSDGRHTPEVYYLGQHRPASLVNSLGSLAWDSEDEHNRKGGASRIVDTLLQDDKRRSRLVEVVIANGGGLANLPPACEGKIACDVSLIDRENGSTLVPLVKHGFIMRQENDRIGLLETASGFAAVPLHGNETVLNVTGCENFLNRRMKALIPADGKYPNDYIRECCQDAGMPASLWSRIGAGNIGYPKIAPTRPGRYPHLKPSEGTTYLQAINDVVRNHCKGASFWSDGLGVRLDKFTVRNRPSINYGVPASGVAVDSHLCLRGDFKLQRDISNYVTSATFIGAKDPKTGQRCSATVSIPQAHRDEFESSVFHIDGEVPYVADADDALRTEADCRNAAMDYLCKTPLTPDGLAPHFADIQVDFDATLMSGDLVRLFDVKVLVDSIEFAAFNSTSNGEDGQQIKVGLQLAEDRELVAP